MNCIDGISKQVCALMSSMLVAYVCQPTYIYDFFFLGDFGTKESQQTPTLYNSLISNLQGINNPIYVPETKNIQK